MDSYPIASIVMVMEALGTPVGDIFQSFLPFGEGLDGFRPLHLTYMEREAEKSFLLHQMR